MRTQIILVPWILTLVACSPLISYTPTRAEAPLPPRAPSEVELYLISVPACPYQEVGIIEGHQRLAPEGTTLAAMRREAGRRGADALLLVDRGHGGGRVHGDGSHDYAAVAIVFSDPACSRDPAPGDGASGTVGP